MNHLGPLSDLRSDPDFVTRIGRCDPVKRQRGRGAGFAGLDWIAYGLACAAYVRALAKPGHVKAEQHAVRSQLRGHEPTKRGAEDARRLELWNREDLQR